MCIGSSGHKQNKSLKEIANHDNHRLCGKTYIREMT
jgi:hypothetical protein